MTGTAMRGKRKKALHRDKHCGCDGSTCAQECGGHCTALLTRTKGELEDAKERGSELRRCLACRGEQRGRPEGSNNKQKRSPRQPAEVDPDPFPSSSADSSSSSSFSSSSSSSSSSSTASASGAPAAPGDTLRFATLLLYRRQNLPTSQQRKKTQIRT